MSDRVASFQIKPKEMISNKIKIKRRLTPESIDRDSPVSWLDRNVKFFWFRPACSDLSSSLCSQVAVDQDLVPDREIVADNHSVSVGPEYL